MVAAAKYVLYGAPGSGSGIIEAALAELGVDAEVVDLDARNGEHLGEAYRRIHPLGKMPALVTGATSEEKEVLTESVAILLSLDERHPGSTLFPPLGSAEGGRALRWMLFFATELYPLVEFTDYPERLAPDAPEALRAAAEGLSRRRWRIVEENIEGAPFLLKSGFCATDLYITKFALWLDPAWRKENLPRVEALTRGVLARPKLRRVWKRHANAEALFY